MTTSITPKTISNVRTGSPSSAASPNNRMVQKVGYISRRTASSSNSSTEKSAESDKALREKMINAKAKAMKYKAKKGSKKQTRV